MRNDLGYVHGRGTAQNLAGIKNRITRTSFLEAELPGTQCGRVKSMKPAHLSCSLWTSQAAGQTDLRVVH